MASIYQRGQTWWLKFRHPLTQRILRHSLDTADSVRADLLRRRIEVEAALLHPAIRGTEIPENWRPKLGLSPLTEAKAVAVPVSVAAANVPSATPIAASRVTLDKALAG